MKMLTSCKVLNHIRLKPENNTTNLILKATICHKSKLPPRKPVKYPFETQSYNLFQMWKDPFTKNKFNENSRVVQIEGNIGSGKHEFANKLAKELDMHVMPDVDIDDYYVNEHGFNYAALNPLLPERLRNCTLEMFHENPARHSVIHMQHFYFKMRLLQYLKAIRHIFSTGQGVILVRSVFTERVFVEAMNNLGWLPRGYMRGDGVQFYDWKDRYIHTRNMVLPNILKPHMTFYLDTPVDKCLERLQSKDDPTIANSKALTPEFLQAIEDAYRDPVLASTEYYSHLMHVDHNRTTIDDIHDIIDEVEPLNFEYDNKDTKFKGWFPENIWLWYFATRREYSTLEVTWHNQLVNQPWFDIAGLGDSIDHVDIKLRYSIHEGHVDPVGYKYAYHRDPNVKNFMDVVLHKGSFDEKLLRSFKSDFV